MTNDNPLIQFTSSLHVNICIIRLLCGTRHKVNNEWTLSWRHISVNISFFTEQTIKKKKLLMGLDLPS
jgi:hypothetical protein